jgi:hypothetical protein
MLWLDKKRVQHPRVFRLVFGLTVALCNPWILTAFGVPDIKQPSGVTCSADLWRVGMMTATGAAGVVEGLVLSEVFFLLLPLVLYVPQTIAMKTLGLLFVTLNYRELIRLTKVFASQARSRARIRVACITGKHLFRSPGSPLYEDALVGNLEVLMPRSSTVNPTVATRYATYPQQQREAEGIPGIADYVREIDLSKDFLLSHGNTVYEHDMLLPWRILLIDTRCIVQNYFPNSRGEQSHKAPAFVFHDIDTSTRHDSIFDSYARLLDIVKQTSQQVIPDTRVVTVRKGGQQSAAPLPPAPQAGPSEGAR